MAKTFDINKKTVFRWLEKGLPVLQKNTKPLLIMGSDLQSFLKDKKVRFPLSKDEYFCLKCKKQVTSKNQGETTGKTGYLIGKEQKEQWKSAGFCDICGSRVQKFLEVVQKD
ncbi:MAG: hypothetical protein KBC17_03185 [Candidatus Pacebacteria bacterium]|nr:hypothetical protein [Candidatus Paceibacterota bacterium]